tara:strand:- start:1156 stop:1632 length:477 start_codon:yes stop_codon:yes gene_type:complete
MNNNIKEINNSDLLLMKNKNFLKKNDTNITNYINENIDKDILIDFKKHKSEIKKEINILFSKYNDISNNLLISNKVEYTFYLFIKTLINNINNINIQASIQEELRDYNKIPKTCLDTSFNILEYDKSMNDISKNKVLTMKNFVNITNYNKKGFIPKKR